MRTVHRTLRASRLSRRMTHPAAPAAPGTSGGATANANAHVNASSAPVSPITISNSSSSSPTRQHPRSSPSRRTFGTHILSPTPVSTPTPPAAALLARPCRAATPGGEHPRDKGKGKGKQRAEVPAAASAAAAAPGHGRPVLPSPIDPTLSFMLDEALSSPLDLPARSSFEHAHVHPHDFPLAAPTPLHLSHMAPLAPPPRALYSPEHLQPALRPRLVSNLTRLTLPTSSLTYAYAEDRWQDQGWRQEYRLVEASPEDATGPSAAEGAGAGDEAGAGPSRPTLRRTSMSSHSYHYTLARYADEYPDLDPITGLPQQRSVSDGTAPERLRVQRTISQLSRYSASGSPEAVNTGPFGLPPLPSLPLPSLRGTRSSIDLSQSLRRTFTASSKASAASDGGVSVAAKFTSLFGGGNKHDALLSEDDQGQTAEEEEAKHHIKYRTPQHPMVFCHGLLGFDYLGPDAVPALQISHWRGIREVLEANGVEVMIARVPATSSIKDRATILHGLIADKYPGRTVNLVAHSMGGLDCRYLISELAGDDFSVASLTTISTPHRGSPFADYVIDSVIGRDRLPQLLGMMEAMRLPETSGDGTALAALGTRAMAEFNMQIVDDPDVKYYSWGASFEPGLLDTFRWPWSVIMAKEGPNDGMVSVASARWGEYRGTLLGVNHLDLVGWVNNFRYMFSGWTGKPIAFKPATFYLEISDYLAEQGF